MSRVLTFSTVFPSYHPKKGEPTFFVDKIWNGLDRDVYDLFPYSEGYFALNKWDSKEADERAKLSPKHHTIRAGKRWKVGDKFSPRIWSSKPYASNQIIIADDIEVKKVFDFEMKPKLWFDECEYYINCKRYGGDELVEVAKNDGLDIIDFACWFSGGKAAYSKRKPFIGQIICWSETIQY